MGSSRGFLLLLTACFLASGCTAISPEESAGTGGSTSCAGEPTRPITQAQLVRTLRRHGFTVYQDPSDVICNSGDPVLAPDPDEDMPVSVTNILFEGPHENLDDHGEIAEREGHVACGLRRGPIWGALEKDLDAPASSPIFSGEKATFAVANLECTIYPDGPASGSQVRKLDRAVEQLARLGRQ